MLCESVVHIKMIMVVQRMHDKCYYVVSDENRKICIFYLIKMNVIKF